MKRDDIKRPTAWDKKRKPAPFRRIAKRDDNARRRKTGATHEQGRLDKTRRKGRPAKTAPSYETIRRGDGAARYKTRRKARRGDKTENETRRHDAERDEGRHATRRFCQLILSFRGSVYP